MWRRRTANRGSWYRKELGRGIFVLKFVDNLACAHPWADEERHPIATYFLFGVLGDPVTVIAHAVFEFAFALFADVHASFDVDAHFARVLGVPAHELLEVAVRAGDEPMLLVALQPVGMHARFRQ